MVAYFYLRKCKFLTVFSMIWVKSLFLPWFKKRVRKGCLLSASFGTCQSIAWCYSVEVTRCYRPPDHVTRPVAVEIGAHAFLNLGAKKEEAGFNGTESFNFSYHELKIAKYSKIREIFSNSSLRPWQYFLQSVLGLCSWRRAPGTSPTDNDTADWSLFVGIIIMKNNYL